MKFERGRKKNQLIWSFILKDIASQSSVLNKTEKENVSEGLTLSVQRKRILRNTSPLKTCVGGAGSLTVGPGGPTGQG